MKTIALGLFGVFAVLTAGCAASTPADDTGSSEGAQSNAFGDTTPGGREAVRLLKAKPLSSMSIASSTGYTWRFDMSATGFTATSVDHEGGDNTKFAWAIDTSGAEPKLTGIATDYPYTTSDRVRQTMLLIKADLDAARARIPEMEDPGMPSDPSTWKPGTPEHCSGTTANLIIGTMEIASVLAVGGIGISMVGGAAVGVWAIAIGGIAMVTADAANALICNERSELWSTSADQSEEPRR